MKNKTLIISIISLIILQLTERASAQTNVSGAIDKNTTWSVSQSPYLITDNIIITSGVTLTIEPGVTVSVEPSKFIRSEGAIIAKGTKSDSIHFQSNANSEWKGLEFKQGGGTVFTKDTTYKSGSILRFVKIKNASTGLSIEHTGLMLKNSSILNTTIGVSVELKAINVLIDSVNFTDNGVGVAFRGPNYSYQENIWIRNSYFKNHQTAIDIKVTTYSDFNSIYIEHNIFRDNNLAISYRGDSYPWVRDIRIKNNLLSGNSRSISIDRARGQAQYRTYPLLILYNVIEDSESGIEYKSNTLPCIVYKNIFRNLKEGIVVSGSSANTQFNRNTFTNIEHPVRFGSIGDDVNGLGRISFLRNNFIHNQETDLIKIHKGSGLIFRYNNFLVDISNSSYIINNTTGRDVNAPSNYWNTSEITVISDKIFDKADDVLKGTVAFVNYLTTQNTDGPMSAPANVFRGLHNNDVLISWDHNEQSSVAGYKIYSKSDISDEFTLLADVGNVTSFETDQVKSDIIVVTSYNNQADGTNDLLQENESDYSLIAENYISNLSVSSNSLCEGAILEVELNSTFSFNDNYFILQLSNVNGSFENAVNLDSITSTNETLSSILPDTIQYEISYYIRVLSSELNFHSEPIEITRHKNPSLLFEVNESVCLNENYEIDFVGSSYTNVLWDFNGANIISGSGTGPYLLNWNTHGQKEIYFSAFNSSCSEDTTIIVNISTNT